MSLNRSRAVIPLFLIALVSLSAQAAPQGSMGESGKSATAKTAASGARAGLDTLAVRRLYLDGEFESAIEILEAGLKAKRLRAHSDSIFAFKHLGVMYAAKYETREKGRYYMHQLLLTEPTARILDMYASEMIYMIFKNIQAEFESNRAGFADRNPDGGSKDAGKETGSVETGAPPDAIRPAPTRKDKESKPTAESGPSTVKKRNYYWIGATGLLVAAGVGAYFLMADDPVAKKQDHPIDP